MTNDETTNTRRMMMTTEDARALGYALIKFADSIESRAELGRTGSYAYAKGKARLMTGAQIDLRIRVGK